MTPHVSKLRITTMQFGAVGELVHDSLLAAATEIERLELKNAELDVERRVYITEIERLEAKCRRLEADLISATADQPDTGM